MKIADLHNLFLKSGEHWLREGFQSVALEIVEQGNAELLLVRALNEAQIRLQNCLLVRFEITEQVRLY
jgi:hypothetical protein